MTSLKDIFITKTTNCFWGQTHFCQKLPPFLENLSVNR